MESSENWGSTVVCIHNDYNFNKIIIIAIKCPGHQIDFDEPNNI